MIQLQIVMAIQRMLLLSAKYLRKGQDEMEILKNTFP